MNIVLKKTQRGIIDFYKENEVGDNCKKSEIMNCAKVRFEKYGFNKTNTIEICKDAHISKKTLYTYFKSKEDIFESIFIREILNTRKETLKSVAHIKDTLKRLEQLTINGLIYQEKEPFIKIILQHENGLYAPYQREKFVTLVETEMVNIISEIIEEGINKGQIREINSKLMAYFIFKLFQSLAYGRTKTLSAEYKVEDEVKQMYELICKGISTV